MAEAWNHAIAKDVAENRLERQDIVLTVPASFDAVARDLTVEAARAASGALMAEVGDDPFTTWDEVPIDSLRGPMI